MVGAVTVLALVDQLTNADPDQWVSQACAEAEARLPGAVKARDYDLLMEIKTGAEDTYNRAFRQHYPQAVRLRAARTIRRVERAIGQALRAGQAAGKIRIQGQNSTDIPGAAQVLNLRSRTTAGAYYEMATGTDAEFELALNAAEAAGNLARSVVCRYLGEPEDRGDDWIPDPSDRTTDAAVRRRVVIKEMAAANHSSRQISDVIGTTDVRIREIAREMKVKIRADEVVTKTRRSNDANRIAAEVTTTLDGLSTAVGLIDFAELDAAQAQNWATSLDASLRVLNRFAKQLKDVTR